MNRSTLIAAAVGLAGLAVLPTAASANAGDGMDACPTGFSNFPVYKLTTTNPDLADRILTIDHNADGLVCIKLIRNDESAEEAMPVDYAVLDNVLGGAAGNDDRPPVPIRP